MLLTHARYRKNKFCGLDKKALSLENLKRFFSDLNSLRCNAPSFTSVTVLLRS